MSVILQASLPNQIFLTEGHKQEITSYINQYRKAHQVPDLIWDDNISLYSQEWSNYLLSNNVFQHSGSSLYGENLAYFKGYGEDPMTLIKLSIDMWYQEIKDYDFTNPGFRSTTGHFTCLVWKSSKKLGMGISISNNTAVISFNTSPPGNILGEFEQNVFPKVDNIPIPLPTPVPEPAPAPAPEPAPGLEPMPTPQELLPSFSEISLVPPKQHTYHTHKIVYMITMLYKIIDELKKPNTNKQMIIQAIQQMLVKLINM